MARGGVKFGALVPARRKGYNRRMDNLAPCPALPTAEGPTLTSDCRVPGSDFGTSADTVRQGAQILQKIGWEPAQLAQLALYARIPPARKIAAMLALRHQAWHIVRDRIAFEHPDLAPADLARLVQQQVAAVCDY